MKHRLPGIETATGKVGFELLEKGYYVLEIKELTVKDMPNGRTNWRFNCTIMGAMKKQGDELVPADIDESLLGRPYNEFIFLLDPDEEWFHLGANSLKNALIAFGAGTDGDDVDLDISNWDSLQAIAKIVATKPKAYEKNGETIQPETRNEIKEWFAMPEDDED